MQCDYMSGEQKKPTHVPVEVIEAWLRDQTRSMRDELLKSLVTREEFENFKADPFAVILAKFGPTVSASIEKKLAEHEIGKKVDDAIVGLNKRVEQEQDSQVDKLRESADKAVIEAVNRIEGTGYKTIDEAIRQVRKARGRRRLGMILLSAATALGVIGAGAAWYHSNQRTAEGAAGVARTARLSAEEAKADNKKLEKELADYKKEDSEWQKKHDSELVAEKAEREKRLGELEQRLTGQITNKLDKTEWGAKVADLEKKYGDAQAAYKQIDTLLRGEIAKNSSREEAYGKYAALAESSKKELDELRLRISGLKTEFPTKEYTDSEISKMRTSYDSLAKNLGQKYNDLLEIIKKMQETYKKNEERDPEEPPKDK